MRSPWNLALATAALLGSAAAAHATPSEDLLREAFTRARAHGQATWVLTGTTTTASGVVNHRVEGRWRTFLDGAGRPGAQLELVRWQDGVAMARAVGDGLWRWSYDTIRNEHSSTNYRPLQGALPVDWRDRLLGSTVATSAGLSTPMAAWMRDLYGGSDPMVRRWLPGAFERLIDTGTAVDLVDPARVYAASDTRWFIQYGFLSGQERTMVYELTRADALSPWDLAGITWGEARGSGAGRVITTWRIAPDPALPIVDANFVFLPPPGSRPIVARGGL